MTERRWKARWWLLGGIIFALLCVPGCKVWHYYGEFSGQVVDIDTKTPLQGTAVHVSYFSEVPTLAGSNSWYLTSQETLTDNGGRFQIPAKWVFAFRPFTFFGSSGWFTVFKPGYGCYPGPGAKPGSGIMNPAQDIVIRLPKILSKKDREKSVSCRPPSYKININEFPLFLKLINFERANIGLDTIKQ